MIKVENLNLNQFSLLHFSVGVIAYFWNISLLVAFALHFLFEWWENSPNGIRLIQTYFIKSGLFDWPGGKSNPDSSLNIFGDNLVFVLGWVVAYYADYYGRSYGFYTEKGLQKFWKS